LPDRIELVLVTAKGDPIHRTVAVKGADVNQAILAFHQALKTPNAEVKAPAKALFNLLIQPIASDLAQAKAKTILFSPDGALRYVPLAALYDGQHWLVERYATNTILSLSLTNVQPPIPKPKLQVLAAAVSEGIQDVQIGDRKQSFPAMPFTRKEVENLAALIPNTKLLLNKEVTREALMLGLRDRTVLHLATNVIVPSGKPEDSFILLGNGNHLTFKDLQTWPLANLELLVLSACETALGGANQNNAEVLGLGSSVLKHGAKAVMVSLWAVDDRGTALLMDQFYRHWVQGTATKAEALQQAQIALLRGGTGGTETPDQNKASGRIIPGQRVKPSFSHPYYWAPFILIGNSL
jgi:CHAT domain-containing protein